MEGNEHWSNEFEHESLATPESREAFTSAMSKYNSQEEAIIGGFNAIKMAGKPFKLPESIDKLPENMRGEFTQNAMKVLGIESGISSVDDLKDIDLKTGLAEGINPDENLAESFKKFAAENKWTKKQTQSAIGFYNQAMTQARQAYAESMEAKKLEAATKTNEALIKHYGSKEKVSEQSELVKRAFKDHAGLSAEEFEQVGELLADSVLTKDPVLTKALMTLVAPLAAEGVSHSGSGGGKDTETVYQRNKRLYPNSPQLWGDPNK